MQGIFKSQSILKETDKFYLAYYYINLFTELNSARAIIRDAEVSSALHN